MNNNLVIKLNHETSLRKLQRFVIAEQESDRKSSVSQSIQSTRSNLSIYLIFLSFLFLCFNTTFASPKIAMPEAHYGGFYVPGNLVVVMCEGPVYYCPSGEREWKKVVNGQTIMHGDGFRTLEHGYAVLSWDTKNLVCVKPNSGIKAVITPELKEYKLCLQLFNAEIMISARESAQIHTESRFGTSLVGLGDSSIISNDKQEIIRSAKGNTVFKLALNGEEVVVPEGYTLELEPSGVAKSLQQFNISTEYENYRRFDNWLKHFESDYKQSLLEIIYRIDSVKVNGEFISNMRNENGLFIIETDDKKIPKNILFQFKLTPSPPPNQRFELSIGKDLVYAVRDGRDDYFEVNFALPSIPDFYITLSKIDKLDRRIRLYNAGFSVFNKRSAELKAREFCKDLSEAVRKRDQIWFRKYVSKDFRDFQGNTWTDFSLAAQTTMRKYRDIRFMVHPFRFEFRKGETLVHVNYRLTALTGDWKYRYEDKGSDIYTLKSEEGVWKLKSKVSGMFFNRMKTTLDLRKAVLRGKVTDERTGAPLEGVKVTVVGTKYYAITNSMGEYVIYSIEPGKYNIVFSKNGYGDITAGYVTLSAAGEYH